MKNDLFLFLKLIFTCRLSNSCKITFTTRRHCSACRLKKCFQQGMKKELIRSVKAINYARSVAIINLSQSHTLRPTTVREISNSISLKNVLFSISDEFFLSM